MHVMPSKTQSGPVTRAEGVDIRALIMYGLLLISYALNAADRQVFPLLGPDVRKAYGFSLANMGLLATIFTLGMAVAGLPTGHLLARFSRKTTLQFGIFIFSLATALTAFSRAFPDMMVYRAATGIGEAMQLTVMFAIAGNYFLKYRGAAVGSINFCYGIGAFLGPIGGAALLSAYRSWRVPLIVFGLIGVGMILMIAISVRPWFSETQRVANTAIDVGGAELWNRNIVVLAMMSIIFGLILYGYLGLYPTFLREALHYAPKTAGWVMSFYGLGALASIAGGWLGDRLPPRALMSGAFFCTAILGYLFFHGSPHVTFQAVLTLICGVIVSATIYVNLAAFHVKSVRAGLAGRASGVYVTSVYGSSAFSGYVMGWLAGHYGWVVAGEVQISLLAIIGGCLALLLRPEQMSSVNVQRTRQAPAPSPSA